MLPANKNQNGELCKRLLPVDHGKAFYSALSLVGAGMLGESDAVAESVEDVTVVGGVAEGTSAALPEVGDVAFREVGDNHPIRLDEASPKPFVIPVHASWV